MTLTGDPLAAVTDIGILIAAIFAAASAIFAGISANATGKAIRAQTFLGILSTAREIDFSQCMDAIRSLPDHDDFDAFERRTPTTNRQIRAVVDFLNDVTHVIRHGYVTPDHILALYTYSILDCKQKLLTWWLPGFRRKYPNQPYYENFEFLCLNVGRISGGQFVSWPAIKG